MKTKTSKLTKLILLSVLFFTGGGINLFSQYFTDECYNKPWPVTGYVGIQTGIIGGTFRDPVKPLHIDSYHSLENTCPDAAIRLSFRSQESRFWGHLALETGYNEAYSIFATTKDLVLQADTNAKNLILTSRNSTGSILFGTTQADAYPIDRERLRIWPDGKIIVNHRNILGQQVGYIDFNLNPNYTKLHEFPKITLTADDLEPSIRFYRAHDDDVTNTAHTWRIKQNYVNLELQSKIHEVIPNNTSDPTGITNDNPTKVAEFQRDGTVIFWDNSFPGYSNVFYPNDSHTPHFMWTPEKKALRAGKVDGTQWNEANIGEYSVAFGYNNEASGTNSLVTGNDNITKGKYSEAFGESNFVNCFFSVAWGARNNIYFADSVNDDNNYVFGDDNTVLSSDECIVNGTENQITQGEGCFVSGNNNYIETGIGAIAVGSHNIISSGGGYTGNAAIGQNCKASGAQSSALGNNVSTNDKQGSFIIGDYTQDNATSSNLQTESNKNNQMTMRFTGEDNCTDADNACFRLITHVGKDVPENGLYLYHNGHGWLGYSDSTMKRDITPVNVDSILFKICNVPVSTWKWKADTVYKDSVAIYDSLSYTWLGPMAQDFYREFPIGVPNNRLLSESVMRGVTFAGVQSLKKITDSLKANQDTFWHRNGDNISESSFLGAINDLPLILKSNSTELIRLTQGEITMKAMGIYDSTMEEMVSIKICSDTGMGTGAYMAPGESGWRYISDKNKKKDFKDIDLNDIYIAFDKTEITSWLYKQGTSNTRYIGPMAQDLYSSFNLNAIDSTSINSIIIDGINFAGIKSLIKKTKDLDSRLDSAVTKSDFNSFKDSISCYSEACNKIKDLEGNVKELKETVSYLKNVIDSLTNKKGGIIRGKDGSETLSISNQYDDIILEQNNPNPFSETTEINYYIPSRYSGTFKLVITDENGTTTITDYDICVGKPCQIKVSSKNLNTGIFHYCIQINGQIVKSKKMMVIK